jgi:hypothetical protein
VNGSNTTRVAHPDLCTLQLSPLYHREEGIEEGSRNMYFLYGVVIPQGSVRTFIPLRTLDCGVGVTVEVSSTASFSPRRVIGSILVVVERRVMVRDH